MKKYSKLAKMIRKLMEHSPCDVIIFGDRYCVGLYYDREVHAAPVVVFKTTFYKNLYLIVAAEYLSIPCEENKPLARSLYFELEENDLIHEEMYSAVSIVLKKVYKETGKNSEDNINNKYKNDFLLKVFKVVEEDRYRKAKRKYFQNERIECKENYNIKNVTKFIDSETITLAKCYDMEYKKKHFSEYELDLYTLEKRLENPKWLFRHMIAVSLQEQKIYVENGAILHVFDIKEAEIAIDYLNMMVKTCTEEIKSVIEIGYKEYDINPKVSDIVENSVKSILRNNYNQTGMEYSFNSDKRISVIYLKNRNKPDSKMFEVHISHKEFLRNPEAFQKFIENPKRKEQWNFLCRERKYKKECFETRYE